MSLTAERIIQSHSCFLGVPLLFARALTICGGQTWDICTCTWLHRCCFLTLHVQYVCRKQGSEVASSKNKTRVSNTCGKGITAGNTSALLSPCWTCHYRECHRYYSNMGYTCTQKQAYKWASTFKKIRSLISVGVNLVPFRRTTFSWKNTVTFYFNNDTDIMGGQIYEQCTFNIKSIFADVLWFRTKEGISCFGFLVFFISSFILVWFNPYFVSM